jgi:hypothetical protein
MTIGTSIDIYLDAEFGLATAFVGGLTAVGKLIGIPAALLTPLIVARWGERRTVVGSTLGIAASFVPVALISHWTAAGPCLVTSNALGPVRLPAVQVYAMGLVASRW